MVKVDICPTWYFKTSLLLLEEFIYWNIEDSEFKVFMEISLFESLKTNNVMHLMQN